MTRRSPWLALLVVASLIACGGAETAGNEAPGGAEATAPPPPPPPAPAAPNTPPRDLTQIDVCALASAADVAGALSATPETSTQSPDATGTGCTYAIAVPGGTTDHYSVWITPPEQYQVLRDLEDDSIEELNDLGSEAYVVEQEGGLPWSVRVLRRDELHLEVAGATRRGAIDLAELILNEL